MGQRALTDNAEESEKSIEAYLVRKAALAGGLALKYSNPSQAGYPDRLLILPDRPAVWVELKSRGKKPRPLQVIRHNALRALGQRVYVADSKEQVDNIFKEMDL